MVCRRESRGRWVFGVAVLGCTGSFRDEHTRPGGAPHAVGATRAGLRGGPGGKEILLGRRRSGMLRLLRPGSAVVALGRRPLAPHGERDRVGGARGTPRGRANGRRSVVAGARGPLRWPRLGHRRLRQAAWRRAPSPRGQPAKGIQAGGASAPTSHALSGRRPKRRLLRRRTELWNPRRRLGTRSRPEHRGLLGSKPPRRAFLRAPSAER